MHKEIKEQLINEIKKNAEKFFGEYPEENPEFPKIINRKHFDRLKGLIQTGDVIYGGRSNEKTNQIALTSKMIEHRVINEISYGGSCPAFFTSLMKGTTMTTM